MAPNRGHNRQREFADIAPDGTKDFDPEEEQIPHADDDASEFEESAEEFDGREHYAEVEKSKLRKAKTVPLGPQYQGLKIGRDDLESEDEDDPFSRGLMEDGDSNSDDGVLGDEHSAGSDHSNTDQEDEELDDATDATDLSDGEDERFEKVERGVKQDELRQVIKHAGNTVAKTLSQASKEEAQKGRAVKRQRTAFDSLLNTRIKLQKSSIATNTLVGTSADQIKAGNQDAQQALEAAETAAFNFWSSLNAFRDELSAIQHGQKRKRREFSSDASSEDIWHYMQAQEAESLSSRDAVLEKWSKKAQGPSMGNDRLHQTKQDTITTVLREQLLNPSRLLARAHAPRSCAPLQVSQRISQDQKIYDDADFYGLLLKELLEQKSQDSVAASNIDLGFQVRREAKTKRNVDTKASKGRKLRYTVHEKLQNFMAPEDRTKWGSRQADELFGSLFGQRLGLAEKDEHKDMDDVADEADAGLLMFRS